MGPTGKGLGPVPYIRGGIGGFVNIGRSVLWEGTIDNRQGGRTTASLFGDKKTTQGLGVTTPFLNAEVEREMRPGQSVTTIKFGTFGLIGMELNSNNEFFIGLTAEVKWLFALGVEGRVKVGVKY